MGTYYPYNTDYTLDEEYKYVIEQYDKLAKEYKAGKTNDAIKCISEMNGKSIQYALRRADYCSAYDLFIFIANNVEYTYYEKYLNSGYIFKYFYNSNRQMVEWAISVAIKNKVNKLDYLMRKDNSITGIYKLAVFGAHLYPTILIDIGHITAHVINSPRLRIYNSSNTYYLFDLI